MTLDEAIKYVEEAAIEEERLCKRYDAASGYLRSHNESIRTSDAKKHEKHAEELRQFAEWFKELKKLMEQTRWIPVKERLPETDGDYLLFGKIDDFDDEYYKFIGEFDSAAEKFGICRDCFYPNTLGCLGSEFYEYGEVLAWMPLPDDYNEGVEE